MIHKICPLCDSALHRPYLQRAYALAGVSLDLVRCQGCGLIRVDPMPEPDEVRDLYSESYFDRDFGCGVREGSYLENEASRAEESDGILRAIRPFCPSGAMIEVGCAAGSFLNRARSAGYAVKGVDVSPWASRTAEEAFHVKVHVGRLMEVGLPSESFDVAFLGDLIEHEADPVSLMSEIHRLLRPQGVVAIKAPTYVNSFYYRALRAIPASLLKTAVDRRLLEAMKILQPEKPALPYHLYEHSGRTLEGLCEKVGLRVLGHKTSLLMPEFLAGAHARVRDRAVYAGFALIRAAMVGLNLPAGHVLVLARKEV